MTIKITAAQIKSDIGYVYQGYSGHSHYDDYDDYYYRRYSNDNQKILEDDWYNQALGDDEVSFSVDKFSLGHLNRALLRYGTGTLEQYGQVLAATGDKYFFCAAVKTKTRGYNVAAFTNEGELFELQSKIKDRDEAVSLYQQFVRLYIYGISEDAP